MVMMEVVSERAKFVNDSIPIEIVDDDELAAIETAFLQVSSVQCTLESSAACSGSLACGRPLQSKLSLAESASYWLRQCSNVKERGRKPDSGTLSVPLLEVHTVSSVSCSSVVTSLTSNGVKAEGQSHSSCCKDSVSLECCRSHEKATLVSSLSAGGAESNATGATAQNGHPQGQNNEAATPVVQDIEDLPSVKEAAKSEEEEAPPEPKPRCLSVTDFTAFEWCEKQVEFTKRLGKPKQTEAMKAGSARHAELEVEVLKKVEVEITSKEDSWAMRLINFITGARQMRSEGMTRELPVVGLIGGAWVIGIIDELKMCERDGMHRPQLIDTKTRNKPTPPSPPQKQNGRMQLMVYKCLWDNIVTSGLPFHDFFEHFRLRPQHLLSEDIRVHAAEIFPDAKVENLQDVSRMYLQECITFPESHSLLLLRYEWQADRSLLGQDEFDIEREWLDLRIGWHLEFWHGLREPAYVPEDETWKCRYCAFAELCPLVEALNIRIEPKQVNQNSSSQKPQEAKDTSVSNSK
ncbi:hypothetical protein KC19_12G077600 [Ceratodon purpureus]|uniref:Exonuclease V n=1 Tax=Ceratodon purpureus TaxID=3225 RepID=A0A8T0GAF4_CERPU|nr:hypothetical protein KC19_12G077600 [Ceratodon purpureus]KAG0554264.1 hypothetical protein KC19_12G077600 [Ceratodon purpureus]